MTDVERLKDELARAEVLQEMEALRSTVEDPETKSPEAMAKFRELNDQLSAMNRAFKEKYPPPEPAEGDAVATPATVSAQVSSVNGEEV